MISWKGRADVMRDRKGFTLIELLVVIAIIALLMAILIPALRRAKSQTKRVLCSTNLRQWGIGLTSYSADNDGFFPYSGPADSRRGVAYGGMGMSSPSSVVRQFWHDYLMKINSTTLKGDNNVLYCPTNKQHRWAQNEMGSADDDNTNVGSSFWIGYIYLPYSTALPNIYNFGEETENWVMKKKFGGKHSRAPVMMDIKKWFKSTQSWWMSGDNSVPLSNHVSRQDGIPDGGYYLFEDGSVIWYDNSDIDLGCINNWWEIYFKPIDFGRTSLTSIYSGYSDQFDQ